LLADGGFERARLDASDPFAWQFVGEGGLDVRIGTVPGFAGRAVSVASSLSVRRVFASQALQLAPGRYRLSWRAREENSAASGRIGVRLTCLPLAGPFADARPGGADRFVAPADVPTSCPTQWLELAVEADAAPTTLDDFAITRD
jgi:hypothetical protein